MTEFPLFFSYANLSLAITFVLSDTFKDKSKQEKRAMLHEGVSVAARQ